MHIISQFQTASKMYFSVSFRIVFIFWVAVCNNILAQSPILFGDSGNESFTNILLLKNDGYVLSGSRRADGNGSDDISLHFFNAEGTLTQCNYFGKEKSDLPFHMSKARNRDLLLTGQGFPNTNSTEPFAILYRINEFGQPLWDITLNFRTGYVIRELRNGNIAVAGFEDGDYWLTLLTSSGEFLQESNYGTIYKDYVFGLLETSDSGLLLGGIKNGFHSPEGHDYKIPDSNLLFIKTNEKGEELWQKEIGGAGHDFLSVMEMGADQNIYVAGSTQGDGKQSFDAFLMKMDEEANVIWQRTVGGADFEYGSALSIAPTGEIYLCGTTNSDVNSENPDIFISKFDTAGNQLWYKQLGSSNADYAKAITVNSLGEIILAGSSKEGGNQQYLIVKLDSDGEVIGIKPVEPNNPLVFLSPNPTTDIVRLTIAHDSFCEAFQYTLMSINGKTIESRKAYGSVWLDFRNLPKGIYVVNVLLEDGTKFSERILKK